LIVAFAYRIRVTSGEDKAISSETTGAPSFNTSDLFSRIPFTLSINEDIPASAVTDRSTRLQASFKFAGSGWKSVSFPIVDLLREPKPKPKSKSKLKPGQESKKDGTEGEATDLSFTEGEATDMSLMGPISRPGTNADVARTTAPIVATEIDAATVAP